MEKNKRENMSNVFYFLGRILTNKLVIALIIIAVLGGISLGVKQVAFTDNKTTKLGFEDIGELATQEARCTEVNVTDQSKKLFGIKIPFTQSKYIYSYDVVVKAGIDFNKITWSVKDKTITVKITNDVEKLIAYRKISFDIIWWDAEGFRIPNEAIKEENGLSYVVRNRNGYYNKMLVKILKQNDEYCIVRQYKTEELEELGFTSSQIYSMRNIALYDEIVLNPTDEQMLQ